ncbi:fumarylacetoacetate hydrolase family protein [Pusillimonas sp. SM2304]|uniref:fumarylacetoacetate hydrolase family protein n=1 Tax=Pusillimonas sp. SM2304 TaxID=3073241 RepID=UPI002876B1EE|nr:fumarylacetoacetate hydrolase family protein [Pusillimonas sp. SM2304]MDS1140179.1 fumarylacetoacetate hydrolase family protein [Pusillimonas sp. SM2304]
MKIVSFELKGAQRFGVAREDGIVDLTDKVQAKSVREVLEQGALGQLGSMARDAAADHALDAVQLMSPVPVPGKIICVGVNYNHRNEEYKDGTAPPQYPSVFPRFPSTLVGHGRPLICPVPESTQLDYEGEIAIIIGKRGRRIALQDAESHIAGLTCMNEGTVRDWIRHGKFNVTQGKNFDESGAIGPWMVTADEFSGFDKLEVITRVNGEERQRDTTAHLMFSFAFLIHYISRWTTLEPGDVISTGTPTGAGVRFDPPRFLSEGDVVEVEVPGIGILRNPVKNG